MSLQNRVTPFGELIATDARGTFMGNRGGVIHNSKQELTARRWVNNRWIICLLDFKGRRRPVMAPGCYTELFFLDEATALAAGHRPCAECRRDDFNRFKTSWIEGNPQYGFTAKTSIDEIDNVLHGERVTSEGGKITFKCPLGNLPDGTLFALPGQPETALISWQNSMWRWTSQGYSETTTMREETLVDVLTPASTVNALRSGFIPEVAINPSIYQDYAPQSFCP